MQFTRGLFIVFDNNFNYEMVSVGCIDFILNLLIIYLIYRCFVEKKNIKFKLFYLLSNELSINMILLWDLSLIWFRSFLIVYTCRVYEASRSSVSVVVFFVMVNQSFKLIILFEDLQLWVLHQMKAYERLFFGYHHWCKTIKK